MPPRRFPPPWTIEELDPGFVVKDSTGWNTGSLQWHGGDRESSAASHQCIIDICAEHLLSSTCVAQSALGKRQTGVARQGTTIKAPMIFD